MACMHCSVDVGNILCIASRRGDGLRPGWMGEWSFSAYRVGKGLRKGTLNCKIIVREGK